MKKLIFILFIFLVIPLASCAKQHTEPVQPEETGVSQLECLDWPVLQTINENQSFRILDIYNNNVLLALDEKAEQEQGVDKTIQLMLFSLESGDIVETYPLDGAVFCNSGVVNKELDIVYALLNIAEGYDLNHIPYQIYVHHYGKSAEKIEISGICGPINHENPYLVRLDEEFVVYSLWDVETQSYGLYLLDWNNQIKPQFEGVQEEGNSLISTITQSCMGQYLYLTEQEDTGIFLVGDKDGINYRIKLPQNEQLYSYCLLENGILFSSYVSDSPEGTDYLIYRDFSGNELVRKEYQAIYRLTTNGAGQVLGRDGTHEIHEFSISPQEIKEETIEVHQFITGKRAVQFYPMEDNQFLMFFYMQKPQVVLKYAVLT